VRRAAGDRGSRDAGFFSDALEALAMDSLSDPGRFFDDDRVDWRDRAHAVDAAAFEAIREGVDSHAVVGVRDADGRVLCRDDESHGWTLPATTVPDDEDWAATARHELGASLDAPLALAFPERIRHVAITVDDPEDARRADAYDVVFPARIDDTQADETTEKFDDDALAWFDAVPAEQDGALADDIRLFLE
jgi:ADP-ribose pyrophosphatase YjhB (NUDIX family)